MSEKEYVAVDLSIGTVIGGSSYKNKKHCEDIAKYRAAELTGKPRSVCVAEILVKYTGIVQIEEEAVGE